MAVMTLQQLTWLEPAYTDLRPIQSFSFDDAIPIAVYVYGYRDVSVQFSPTVILYECFAEPKTDIVETKRLAMLNELLFGNVWGNYDR